MKRLILTLLILAFAVSVHAQEPVLLLKDGYRIEQDRWEPETRRNIIDNNGQEVGHVERDRWEPEKKWNIYTKTMNKYSRMGHWNDYFLNFLD